MPPVLPRGTPQLPPPQRPLPPLPSPSLGGRPPDGQGPPAPVAGALEPACRARRRPAPGREASPVRTQRPQPDCPLGPPAAPPSTYPPTPFDTATRQNTLRRNSASGICPIWLRLAKKRRLGARPSRPAYPAVHIPPTRQNPVPRPSRASPHNSPTRRTAPADASTRPQHISPTRQNARASRPRPPRKPPWPARTTRLPGRAAAVATEASRSLPASRTQRPHPRSPHAGTGSASPHVLSPHPDYPANQAQRRFGTPFNTRELARKSMGDVKSTGLGRDRLRSVDRNNKTTLLLTRRCGTNKSYAKDLSPRMVKLQDVS